MAEGTPLYLLLDDLAGSTLISGFAYLRWADHIPMIRNRVANAPRRIMRDICSGFRDGASSLAQRRLHFGAPPEHGPSGAAGRPW